MIPAFSRISWQKRNTLSAAVLVALAVFAGSATDSIAAVVKVRPSACRWLASHDGKDAAYEPGVDVHGRPVAPADVESGGVDLPEVITVDITVDIQDRFGIPADSRLFDPDARIGFVEVRDGRLLFNGAPLGSPEREAVSAACRSKASPD